MAIKLLHDIDTGHDMDTEEALWRECRALTKLHHPHIIDTLGFNHISRKKFIASRLALGGSLTTFFKDESNRELLWDKFLQAVDGLAFLHANGVAHGGLKGRNILLTEDGVVKLSDIGQASMRNHSRFFSGTDGAYDFAARWTAPEILIQSEYHVDYAKADVYSLGLCIVEAVTKELPFANKDREEIIYFKLKREEFERPDGFDEDEWVLVARMLNNDPDARPTAEELVDLMSSLEQRNPRDAGPALSEIESPGRCSVCGRQNPPTYRFCGGCGHSLELTARS